MEWITSEAGIRLTGFVGILVVMAALQAAFPRRHLRLGYRRWSGNLGLVVVDAVILRLLLPAGAMGVALWAEQAGFGLFNRLDIGATGTLIASLLLLDMIIYWQHRMFHAVPLLWRLHRVHHADQEIDVSTGLRFHPLEILLSMLIKMGAVALLGVPALAVLAFEVLLNGMAMFNHSNLRLPPGLDGLMRRLIVTPDMHRVHHSVLARETNSNYGFNLSLWDRLFGSYVPQPEKGHDAMTIGLPPYQSGRPDTLRDLLAIPFRRT